MYSESLLHDMSLFTKAVLSNQLARWWPSLYVKVTGQTGRGDAGKTWQAEATANYFFQCLNDYRDQLQMRDNDFSQYLAGKTVLEYGPGDTLGVALLMYAKGATAVHCVDSFSLANASLHIVEVYRRIIARLHGEELDRANSAFIEPGNPASGFRNTAIKYAVRPSGLVGVREAYDLIISRAVLEHVNDLEKIFLDISSALRPQGYCIHKVDLSSHGLDRYTDFDFLTWPQPIYQLMYGHKGFPNRWRVDRYRHFAESAGLRIKHCAPTEKLDIAKLEIVRPELAKPFRAIQVEELSWLGLWLHLEKPEVGTGFFVQ